MAKKCIGKAHIKEDMKEQSKIIKAAKELQKDDKKALSKRKKK